MNYLTDTLVQTYHINLWNSIQTFNLNIHSNWDCRPCKNMRQFTKMHEAFIYSRVDMSVILKHSTTAVRADVDQVPHLELDYLCLYKGCDSFLCQSFCFKQWLLLSFIQIPMKAGCRFPKKMSQSQWSKYYNPNRHYTADCLFLSYFSGLTQGNILWILLMNYHGIRTSLYLQYIIFTWFPKSQLCDWLTCQGLKPNQVVFVCQPGGTGVLVKTTAHTNSSKG